MDATAFPTIPFSLSKSSKPISLLFREYGRKFSSLGLCNLQSFQLRSSSIGICVNRNSYSFTRGSVLRRAFQEDHDYVVHKPSDYKKNRERLIALLKRIQTSISQDKSGSRNKEAYLLSDDDYSAQTSVLEFLHSSIDTVNERSNQRRGSDKPKSVSISQHPSNPKTKRLPSHFVKKSPIPSPTPLRSNSLEVTDIELPSSEARPEPEKLKEMKLSDLKGLAKERGVRGYSKLKKIELIELLRVHVKSHGRTI